MPPIQPDDFFIREITVGDAAAAAQLTGELGYPVSSEKMEQRLQSLLRRPDGIVCVACANVGAREEVVGWMELRETVQMQSDPRAEIVGLVVSSTCRGQGIGSRLLQFAEDWARGRGLQSIVVRSQIAREDAHRFYLREGYTRTKTSAVFTRVLG